MHQDVFQQFKHLLLNVTTNAVKVNGRIELDLFLKRNVLRVLKVVTPRQQQDKLLLLLLVTKNVVQVNGQIKWVLFRMTNVLLVLLENGRMKQVSKLIAKYVATAITRINLILLFA